MEQQQLFDLLEKSKAGDRQAQEKLVEETQNRVYYHCKKMLKNEDDALDATQDVLIVMLTSLDKLREPAAFWGWVNGITANRCKHLLTQGTREWQIPEDEEGNSLLDDIEDMDEQAVPDKAIDNAETQRLVMEIIDALPPEQKMTVLFYYYDEMPVKEIAAAMEVSEGTVKSRLNYARKSIKEGVEKLEKKGTKLYGVSPLPFLAYFLRQSMAAESLSPAMAGTMAQGVLATAGTAGTAAGATAGTAAGAAAATGTAGSAGGAAASAAAGAAAKGILGSKIALGLAGLAVAGTVAGGVVLSNHPAQPVSTPVPTPTPVQTETVALLPMPGNYAPVYAEKVRELMEAMESEDYLYDLVYIDGDLTPELIAGTAERVSVYSTLDGALYTVREDWNMGRMGVPGYYPGKNVVVEQYSVMSEGSHMEMTNIYFRINKDFEVEEFFRSKGEHWGDERDVPMETPEELEGLTYEPLKATMTAMEILDLLGEPMEPAAPPEPTPEPTPTPEVTPEPTPAVEEFVIEYGVLVKYNGPGGDVVIPDGVTVIGDKAFQGNQKVTSVTIPYGVTRIEGKQTSASGISGAFFLCSNLTTANIPDSVTEIETYAFSATGLTSITIPGSVDAIGKDAFSECFDLMELAIADGVRAIGPSAFAMCTNLTSVTIPESVAEIDFDAFSGCHSLDSVTILNKDAAIGNNAFDSKQPVLTIYGKSGSTAETLYSRPGVSSSIRFVALDAPEPTPTPTPTADPDFTIENGTLVKYNGPGGDVVIPDGVTVIGADAFRYNTTVTSVTIPDGVTYIWGNAYTYGTGSGAFDGCTSLTRVTLPDSLTYIGHGAFQSCTSLTDISLPAGLTSLSSSAFKGCSSLTSITIPVGVSEISWWTFDSCSSLTSVTILNSEMRFRYGLDDGVTKGDPFNGCPATIHGIEGSTAESYAKNHDFPFEPI